MPKSAKPTSKSYPEINDIRDDLESLKSNVVELTRHIQSNGSAQAKELSKALSTRLTEMREAGKREMKNVEKRVKNKPTQSLAMAFAAGVIASIIFGRRG